MAYFEGSLEGLDNFLEDQGVQRPECQQVLFGELVCMGAGLMLEVFVGKVIEGGHVAARKRERFS